MRENGQKSFLSVSTQERWEMTKQEDLMHENNDDLVGITESG